MWGKRVQVLEYLPVLYLSTDRYWVLTYTRPDRYRMAFLIQTYYNLNCHSNLRKYLLRIGGRVRPAPMKFRRVQVLKVQTGTACKLSTDRYRIQILGVHSRRHIAIVTSYSKQVTLA